MDQQQYISMDEAAKQLGVVRGTLHYYLRTLNIQTHKFPLDRRAYLAMQDFERIKALKEQAGKEGTKQKNDDGSIAA